MEFDGQAGDRIVTDPTRPSLASSEGPALREATVALPDGAPRATFVKASVYFTLVLIVASWIFIVTEDRSQNFSFFTLESIDRAWSFLTEDLLGIGSGSRPAFLKVSDWRALAPLAYDTLAMSVLGIGLASIVALITFVFGAGNVMTGDLTTNRRSGGAQVAFHLMRGLFVFTRGVPELIWALLVVFAFSPGILAGAVALGIHNSGILGKLAADVVETLDPRPIRALRSSGAGRLQILFYVVLPQALPKFMTFLLYRWEVIIRTTIVVGFVAAGGLGLEFRLSMSHFHYTSVTLIVIWYLGLVLFVDLVAAGLRRLAR